MALGNDPADTREYCECDGQDPDCPECGGWGWLTEKEVEERIAFRERYAREAAEELKKQKDDARYGALYLLLQRAHQIPGVMVKPYVRVFAEGGAEPMIDAEVSLDIPENVHHRMAFMTDLSGGFLDAFEGARMCSNLRGRCAHLTVDVEVEDLERLHNFRSAHGDLLPPVRVVLSADYSATPEEYAKAERVCRDLERRFAPKESEPC